MPARTLRQAQPWWVEHCLVCMQEQFVVATRSFRVAVPCNVQQPPTLFPQFEKVLDAYRRASKQWSATLNRFAEVRLRGRKRQMVG